MMDSCSGRNVENNEKRKMIGMRIRRFQEQRRQEISTEAATGWSSHTHRHYDQNYDDGFQCSARGAELTARDGLRWGIEGPASMNGWWCVEKPCH